MSMKPNEKFKRYPLNDLYQFNVNGEYKYAGIIQPPEDSLTISTKYGKVSLSTRDFGLISHFELDYPIQEYCKLRFIPTKSNIRRCIIGFYVEHIEPITVGCPEGYRRIPGYNDYAINEKGNIINIYTMKTLAVSKVYGYPCVNIYRPSTSNYGSGRVHNLLASAFIPNPLHKDIVNHIDGNRENCSIGNLEWVTPAENAKHAVDNGKWSSSNECFLRDIVTGEVRVFASLAQAARFIGYGSSLPYTTKYQHGKKIPLLFRRRFELKLAGDDTPWYYTKESALKTDSRGPYEIRNVTTKEVTRFDTLAAIAEFLNVKVGRVYTANLTNGERALLEYQIRPISEDPWPTAREGIDNKSKGYTAYHIESDETYYFSSSVKAAKALHMDRTYIRKYADSNKEFKGYLIFNGDIGKISPDSNYLKPPINDGEALKLKSLSLSSDR